VDQIASLVVRAAAGDVPRDERLAAFGEIVRRLQDMAYGCAYAILGDFHLAEDAAQEAFLAAYRELPNLREPKAFPGWLRRIVITQCNRQTRRRRVPTRDLTAATGVASGDPQPHEAAEKGEMIDKVLAAIRQLPDAQRMATTLFYINGYSQNEIAEFLEVPVTTVKKRLATSRDRLRDRMLSMVDETLKSFRLPGDFADTVVREVASESDLQSAKTYLASGYHGKRQPELFGTLDAAKEAGIYVVEENGQVESAGYFDETVFGIGATPVRAVRPREMAGEAAVPDVEDKFVEFVKGFGGCFKLARDRGIHLAVVHGSMYDHAFCGFVPCFYYPVVTLPCERAKSIVTRATITPTDDERLNRPGACWLLDPYAAKLSAGIGEGSPHVIRQDGEEVGIVYVDRDFTAADHWGMPFGHICNVTVRTRDAALAVIRLGAELAEKAGEGELCLMQSHMTLITQTMLSLGGTYLLRGSCDLPGLDAEMVAIIDLVGLTRDLTEALPTRLTDSPAHDVQAALSVEMGGKTVGFVAQRGRLQIVTDRQRIHRPLPRWVVTRLYAGYYAGADVLAMGPIPWDRSDGKTPDDVSLDNRPLDLPQAEAALFAALFPKLWPVSWPDPDVWPWVIGQEHPKYQHEAGKTAEMKARIDALRFPWIGR